MIPPVKRAAPRRRSRRGGRRAGAGRKRTAGLGTLQISYTLTARHIEKIQRWEEVNGCESASEALRQMIDAVPPP